MQILLAVVQFHNGKKEYPKFLCTHFLRTFAFDIMLQQKYFYFIFKQQIHVYTMKDPATNGIHPNMGRKKENKGATGGTHPNMGEKKRQGHRRQECFDTAKNKSYGTNRQKKHRAPRCSTTSQGKGTRTSNRLACQRLQQWEMVGGWKNERVGHANFALNIYTNSHVTGEHQGDDSSSRSTFV